MSFNSTSLYTCRYADILHFVIHWATNTSVCDQNMIVYCFAWIPSLKISSCFSDCLAKSTVLAEICSWQTNSCGQIIDVISAYFLQDATRKISALILVPLQIFCSFFHVFRLCANMLLIAYGAAVVLVVKGLLILWAQNEVESACSFLREIARFNLLVLILARSCLQDQQAHGTANIKSKASPSIQHLFAWRVFQESRLFINIYSVNCKLSSFWSSLFVFMVACCQSWVLLRFFSHSHVNLDLFFFSFFYIFNYYSSYKTILIFQSLLLN